MESVTASFLEEHPVLSRGLVVVAKCGECQYRGELRKGYYCRGCGATIIEPYPVSFSSVETHWGSPLPSYLAERAQKLLIHE